MTAGERLFQAIPLTAEALLAIEASLSSHGEISGRVTPRRNRHVTLRFFGDTDPSRKAALLRHLAEAELPAAFDARLTGWGAFPRPNRAKVLWAGLADDDRRLDSIARAVETAARTAGFPADDRPFTPHITIARFRTPRDLRRLLTALPPPEGTLRIERMVLFRSLLGSGPPRYDEVAEWRLAES